MIGGIIRKLIMHMAMNFTDKPARGRQRKTSSKDVDPTSQNQHRYPFMHSFANTRVSTLNSLGYLRWEVGNGRVRMGLNHSIYSEIQVL